MKKLDKAFDNIEGDDLHGPHLEEGKISIGYANPRAVTSPNEHEFNYYCVTWGHKDYLIYKKYQHEGGTDELQRAAKISAV